MKEVNAPNEYEMVPVDLYHPLYWIWKVDNIRIKTLDSRLRDKRKTTARFDVFINGLFIRSVDYVFEQVGNDFYIKFKRSNFPTIIDNPNDPNFGQEYLIEPSDDVKIKGDLENVN
jgi:hypothetical protein